MQSIEQINRLYADGLFAQALNGYLAYLDQNGPLSSHCYLNARLSLLAMQAKSIRQLSNPEAFQSPEFLSITSVSDVPFPLYRPSSTDEAQGQWIRIDYIVVNKQGVHPGELQLCLNLLKSGKTGISVRLKAVADQHNALLCFVPWGLSLPENGLSFVDSRADYSVSGQINAVEQIWTHLLFEVSDRKEYRYQMIVQQLSQPTPLLFNSRLLSTEPVSAYVSNSFQNSDLQSAAGKTYLTRFSTETFLALGKRFKSTGHLNLADKADLVQQTLPSRAEFAAGFDFNIEVCTVLDQLLLMGGWVKDPTNALKNTLLCAQGADKALEITSWIHTFARADLNKAFGTSEGHHGFALTVPLNQIPQFQDELEISFINLQGGQVVHACRPSVESPEYSELGRWAGITAGAEVNATTCQKFLVPLFNTVLNRQLKNPEVDVEYLGSQSGKPSVSVIVPLYGHIRFELHQIPSLAALRFPGMEVVFAIDDPSIREEASENIRRLSKLYGLNVTLVMAHHNLGFATINNLGAEHARSDNLLFLNSDCFITKPQSLFKALSCLERKKIGAVGFRLLYPDNTIQHNGMASGLWKNQEEFIINLHPGMGQTLHESGSEGPDESARLLTAACLLMKQQLFKEVGGFGPAYLRGDFEDSDLCMQLIVRGYRLAIVQSKDIYHLERQSISSQEPTLRQQITLVNSYIYTQRWAAALKGGLPNLEVVA